jgi:hypothetical protein
MSLFTRSSKMVQPAALFRGSRRRRRRPEVNRLSSSPMATPASSAKKEIEDQKKDCGCRALRTSQLQLKTLRRLSPAQAQPISSFVRYKRRRAKSAESFLSAVAIPDGLGLRGAPGDFFQETLVESDLNRWQSSIDTDDHAKVDG